MKTSLIPAFLVTIFFGGISLAVEAQQPQSLAVGGSQAASAVRQSNPIELNWLTDLPKALARAKAQGKSVLLFFHGSDWCPTCAEMQREVLDSPEFTRYAHRALVLVDVDFPEKQSQPDDLKRANAALRSRFNIGEELGGGFPTIVLLNEAGGTVFQETGYSGGGPSEIIPKLLRHTGTGPSESAAFKDLSVDDFAQMTAEKGTVILDVRTPKEFEAGHLPGAMNLDVNSPDFETKAASLDKTKTYLVHCASGVRSVKACNKLARLDFPKLYNLAGGFKAWARAGKPVER